MEDPSAFSSAASSAAAAAEVSAADACAALPERITCVDLFTGVGGITLGVSPFVRAIQYCEWDKYCQSVLLQRMSAEDGRLDRAPIHSDVRSLHISPVVHPEMICGGFPCQDISTIGLQKGIIDGKRSSMFYEIMRIVDESPSIKIVFLENVANILNCGIKEVVHECTKRGFTMQWMMRSAQSHGAPHVRTRWFMLACRGDGAERVHRVVEGLLPGLDLPEGGDVWKGREPRERISYRPAYREDPSYDDHWASRCQALGNAVVPHVVRTSFIDLALASRHWPKYGELLADTATPIADLSYPYPESSIVSKGMLYALPKRRAAPRKHGVSIVTPGGPKAGGEMVAMENYPTPRRGITHASTLTDRSVRDLPTILVYCQATANMLSEDNFQAPPEKQLHSVLIPNVNYLEWMMGYAKDWTRIDHSDGSSAIPQAPTRAAVARGAATLRAKVDEEEDPEEPEEAELDGEVQADERRPAKKAAKAPKSAASKPPKAKQTRIHGMHVFMRERQGLDVEKAAKLWRELTVEEKAVFSVRAKELNRLAAVPAPPEQGLDLKEGEPPSEVVA